MSLNHIVSDAPKYLHKKVQMMTKTGNYTGFIKCIDPLTHSVALIVQNSSHHYDKLIVAMGHSITSITIVEDDNDDASEEFSGIQQLLSSVNYNKTENMSEDEILKRKMRVINGLKKNHIPVEESDDRCLIVAYSLKLMAPYDKDNCICSNEIILGKVQKILEDIHSDA